MAGLEMIQVGTDMKNNPVYNVKNKGGGLLSTTIYTAEEAQALIDGAVTIVAPVEVVVEPAVVPDYENMTKLELESMMRLHDIELDRRKSKKELLLQVRKHFNK